MMRRWQCWIYYLPRKGNNVFLYGFMAQTSFPTFETYIERTCDNGIIQVCLAVSGEDFNSVQLQLAENKLGFSFATNLEQILSPLVIQANCSEIRKCLGCTNVHVLSWHTFLPIASVDEEREAQQGILDALSKEVGLDFRKEYAGLVGAFEIYQMPEWAEDAESPFCLSLRGPETMRFPPEQRNHLVFRRRADVAQRRHFLSLKLYAGESLIYDRLHILEVGQTQLGPIVTDEHFNRESYMLYDEQGNLVHEEDFPLLDTISFGIYLGGPTIKLSGDRVSEQAKGIGNEVLEKISTVHVRSMTENSLVTFANTGAARQYLHNQKWYAVSLFDKKSNSAWFENGNEEGIESLLYVTRLIDGYNSKAVILTDPFFDKTAFVDLIPRIATRKLPVTILTNLLPREAKQSGNIVDDWLELCNFADKNKNLIQCKLTIYNVRLINNLNARSFHDRNLIIQKNEDTIEVHLMSNSLNSRSRNFPFCISRLDISTAMHVKAYFDSMMAPNSKKFNISQIWKNYE